MFTQPPLREAYEMKKAIAHREIDNDVARLNSNDKTLSAMDGMYTTTDESHTKRRQGT
jgi:hypothetical protein